MLYKPVGMSMEESLRTDIEVENKLLAEFPEITRIFTRIGTSEIASDPMPPNESDVYIFYKPMKEWPKTAGRPTNKAELREQIDALLKKINPDYNILFAQPIEMRFNEMLEGTKAQLAGEDFRQRLRRARKDSPNRSKASSKKHPAWQRSSLRPRAAHRSCR
jgi:cobalt-zinc-cadmium resistance protein CzcA